MACASDRIVYRPRMRMDVTLWSRDTCRGGRYVSHRRRGNCRFTSLLVPSLYVVSVLSNEKLSHIRNELCLYACMGLQRTLTTRPPIVLTYPPTYLFTVRYIVVRQYSDAGPSGRLTFTTTTSAISLQGLQQHPTPAKVT